VPLTGQVKGADLSKGLALLQVSHRPVVSLGRGSGPPLLPVALAGVSPTQLGLSWLQLTLDQQPVTFTVLATTPEVAIAKVTHQASISNLVKLYPFQTLKFSQNVLHIWNHACYNFYVCIVKRKHIMV
jgi:hypothetical protein